MLRNYLKIALRNLWRNPLYSLLNIGGLAVGLAVSLLVLLFVVHEVTYDRFHTHVDRIFQVYGKMKFGEQEIQMAAMSARFGPAVKAADPDVVDFVRIRKSSDRVVIKTDPEHRDFENRFILADGSLLKVFSFPLLRGNPATALSRPMTVLLTERMARKYFGETDPIGRTLTYDGKLTFEVSGILKDPPSNSTLDFDFVGSLSSHPAVERIRNTIIKDDQVAFFDQSVGMGSYETWFLLRSPEAAGRVARIVPRLVKASGHSTGETKFIFSPLRSVHLGTANFGDTANLRYVYIFLAIALIILGLALINYMSLTTARASKRAKEVGVRKAMGALRRELAAQFYGESFVMTVAAFGLALLLVQLLRPVFFQMLQLRIDDSFLYGPAFLLTILGLLLLCVLLSGSYPAALLSGFRPVSIMKGPFRADRRSVWVRRGFTVLQFAVSLALMVCSLTIGKQLDFMRNRHLGLFKDRVLVLPLDDSRFNTAFRSRVQAQAGVEQVAATSSPLYRNGYSMFFAEAPKTKKQVSLYVMSVDENFFRTLRIPWKISPSEPTRLTTGNTLVLNEVAAREMGIAERPVGRQLQIGGETQEVVGLLKNFNFSSLHSPIQPLAVWVAKDTVRQLNTLYVRLDPKADLRQKVAEIGAVYRSFRFEKPFEYYFLDQAFDALYKAEDRLARMFQAFTAFAVFIAGLGLFGLVTFMAEQRTKEIGIRKVLGASVAGIVALLSKDFLRLILVSVGLASPAAWYIMERWLADFAYRIEPDVRLYVLAGGATLLIALLTVSVQSVRAGLANPVKSLRSE
ncbi:ABC transporter permease [Larkinella soli]|uniref:ABC transporter permease n=1 Tax=Larkinella soli TaxID=1770527 RepID=UPI000FFCA171|nr:ABC transporter permease [Larkinella soli]